MGKYSEICTDHAVVVGSGLESVYIIYYDGWKSRKKIGIAVEQSLGARLSSYVATGSPGKVIVELIILSNNALEIEQILHARFRNHRSRGEWFEIECLWSALNPLEFDNQMRITENFGLKIKELNGEIAVLEKRRDFFSGIEDEISKKIISLADQLGIGGGTLHSKQTFLEQLKDKIEHLMDIEKKIDRMNLQLYARQKDLDNKEKILTSFRARVKAEYEESRKPVDPIRKVFHFFKW